MITAFIICVGSRGDVEPSTALTVALLNDFRFDKVHLCVEAQYRDIIPNDDRIIVHEVPLSLNPMRFVFMWHFFKEKIFSFLRWESFDILRAQCASLTSYVTQIVAPTLIELSGLIKETNPSFILSTSLGGVVGSTLAECANIPFFLLHMQPNTPTSSFPFYLSNIPSSRLAAIEISAAFKNERYKTVDSYLSTYDTQVNFHTNSLPVINSFRQEEGLPEIGVEGIVAIFRGEKENQHILQSYPTHFIPSPPDWPTDIHVIPPLADGFIPPGWNAEDKCPTLKQFLSQGEKPLCVTIGSLTMNGREAPVLQNMLTAFQRSNVQRVVIFKGAAALGEQRLQQASDNLRDWSETHVFWVSESVQYAWLFPKCSSVLCHGGAGTVSAALRAGIPIAVAPIMSDQYFWGDLMQRAGVGYLLDKGLSASSVHDFERAVDTIFSEEVQRKAYDYGVAERKRTDGSSMALSIMVNMIGERPEER